MSESVLNSPCGVWGEAQAANDFCAIIRTDTNFKGHDQEITKDRRSLEIAARVAYHVRTCFFVSVVLCRRTTLIFSRMKLSRALKLLSQTSSVARVDGVLYNYSLTVVASKTAPGALIISIRHD